MGIVISLLGFVLLVSIVEYIRYTPKIVDNKVIPFKKDCPPVEGSHHSWAYRDNQLECIKCGVIAENKQ